MTRHSRLPGWQAGPKKGAKIGANPYKTCRFLRISVKIGSKMDLSMCSSEPEIWPPGRLILHFLIFFYFFDFLFFNSGLRPAAGSVEGPTRLILHLFNFIIF